MNTTAIRARETEGIKSTPAHLAMPVVAAALLLVAGAPFVAGAAIRAARD